MGGTHMDHQDRLLASRPPMRRVFSSQPAAGLVR